MKKYFFDTPFSASQFALQFSSIFLLCILFFSSPAKAQFYTGSQQDFGQNRVQYEPFLWTYYSYDKYDVYFYQGGKEIASYVSQSAKKNLIQLQALFDYQLDNKVEFLVYNKQSEYQQSNLGLSSEEAYNTGGVTHFVGSKIPLYFDGDYLHLDQQIRAGMAQVLLNQMMFGGNLKNMLKNSTLLALPDWFTEGLISYASTGWNVDIDNRVKDGILSGRYNKFNRLTGLDALYAGHSIWKYIADTYGEAVISNILYMTKVSRSVENSFLFVLGISTKDLAHEWLYSYHNQYLKLDSIQKNPTNLPLLKKPKVARIYYNLKISPDGQYAVYTTNELGQQKIWLYNMQTKKAKRIWKAGYKLNRVIDVSYPLLAWHPTGKLFSIITEKEGKLILSTYTIETRKMASRRIVNFDKILDFSYSDDGTKFAMSAVQHGQSDIFVFTVASNGYEQITNDVYDDLHPRFIHHSKGIIFTSDRSNDTLKTLKPNDYHGMQKNDDVFIYNYASHSNVLKRITNTPDIDETYPADYDSSHICFLSTANGIRNRYVAGIDSVISYIDTSAHYRYVVKSFPITNYSRNIEEQEVNLTANKYTEIIFDKGKYLLEVGDLKPFTSLTPMDLRNTDYRKQQLFDDKRPIGNKVHPEKTTTPSPTKIQVTTIDLSHPQQDTATHPKINIDDYSFDDTPQQQAEKSKLQQLQQKKDTSQTVQNKIKVQKKDSVNPFKLSLTNNYRITYSPDYIVTQIGNNFLNSTYQTFTGGGSPIYLNPGFSGFFSVSLSDLFEDYRITAAMRLSGDFNSNEYLLSYETRVNRWDKQLVFHRQAFLGINGNNGLEKIYTNDAHYVLKYPFSEVACIKGTAGFREDQLVTLAVDDPSLQQPNAYQTWGNLKLEYIFDNTINKGLNLYNGFRGKVFGEFYRQINQANTNMFVVGFDARYYQKIHRDFIWANRFSGSTSFGQEKLIYYMGGVDNWFSPSFNTNINIATDQNYAYQTLATPLRGFNQNIRNGNSFLLYNSELRFPIFKYFANRPLRSDFINNFQIIGFTDIGTAWTGPSPYSATNSLNTTIIPGNPITITLQTQQNPIVGGYGFGLRSRIWGYFVRVDWAWGDVDGVIQPEITYLSFSLDF
ncbi:MAG: hypothetical protein ABI199_10745 [Bacteroidia bacterium]